MEEKKLPPIIPKPRMSGANAAQDAVKAYVLDKSEIDPVLAGKIQAEIKRLRRLHPTWKNERLTRKAGEKYNVNLVMQEPTLKKLTDGAGASADT